MVPQMCSCRQMETAQKQRSQFQWLNAIFVYHAKRKKGDAIVLTFKAIFSGGHQEWWWRRTGNILPPPNYQLLEERSSLLLRPDGHPLFSPVNHFQPSQVLLEAFFNFCGENENRFQDKNDNFVLLVSCFEKRTRIFPIILGLLDENRDRKNLARAFAVI